MRIVDRIDRFQRAHRWSAFPYAVVKKYGEDRGGHQAALIAFYGFFSLFPLLLVGISVLGFVLRDHPELQDRVLGSALSAFPVIGDQIRENVRGAQGAWPAIVVGMLCATWAGLAGVNAAQAAMDEVWDVPVRARPGLLARVRRAVTMLVILGGMTVLATGIAGIAGSGADVPLRIAAVGASFVLNALVFLLAFTILPSRSVAWREALPGAALAGAAWVLLQSIGGALVQSRLRGASETYGFFAIVLGLLSWMLLTAQVMLIAAEVNVVRRERLWPRSMGSEPLTAADHRALIEHAGVEERATNEDVSVRFEEPPRRAV